MPPEKKTFTIQNPRFVFGFILFLAVVGVGASGYRISQGIKGGFIPSSNNNESQALSASTDEDQVLKSKDTDSDGLSDYDELHVYITSPYLLDTDSDGINDNNEIAKGSDPNCPEGIDCKEVAPVTGQNQGLGIENQDIIGQATAGLGESDVPDTDATVGAGMSDASDASRAAEVTTQEDVNAQLKNLTASQIRQLLLDSGHVTQEQLNSIDDQTLMKVYAEVVVNSQ